MLPALLMITALFFTGCHSEIGSSPASVRDLRPERFCTHFRDVQFAPGTEHAWLVGFEGLIVHSSDGGRSFSNQDSKTVHRLYDIQPLNDNLVFACGAGGTILRTENGGVRWELLPSPTMKRLVSVCFIDPHIGWVCGDDGLVFRTADGGRTWEQLRIDTTAGLRVIHFNNATTGFVVGYSGSMFRTVDGGTSWRRLNIPNGANIYGACFDKDSGFVIVCGAFGMVLTSPDLGDTWTTLPVVTTSFLRAISRRDTNTYMLAGYGVILRFSRSDNSLAKVCNTPGMALHAIAFGGDHSAIAAGQTASVYISTDAGESWTMKPEYLAPDLFDLARSPDGTVIVVGAEGNTFIRSPQSGEWTHHWIGTTNHLKAIDHVESSRFCVSGTNGILACTKDDGITWSLRRLADRNLNDITFPSHDLGYTVGDSGFCARSTDQGDHWVECASGSIDNLAGIAFADDLCGIMSGSNGCLRETENGGGIWTGAYTGVTADFLFCSLTKDGQAIAGGTHGIALESRSGGLNSSWNRLPLSTDLTAVSDDNRILFLSDRSILRHSDLHRIGTTDEVIRGAIWIEDGVYLCCGRCGYLAEIRTAVQ